MHLPSRKRIGELLILFAIVAVVVSIGTSTLTTSEVGNKPANDTTTDRGRTLVGMQSASQVVAFDSNGDTVWRISGEQISYFDVTKLENGTVLAAFLQKDRQSCGQYESPCARTGFRIIDPNPNPHIINEWSFPVRTGLSSEVHDAEPLPSGEFLLTDMEHERILTLAPNGTITWQWNASQRYDEPPDPTRTDWLHINDVDRVGSDRYMVSIRNANQIVVVERGAGVVNVINEDERRSNDANCKQVNGLADYGNDSGGDIRCGNPKVINHQHNPQYLGEGAVLVADSENDRVVELHRNDSEWTVAWGVNSAKGVGFDWPRDADRLPNGNTLITDSRNNRIIELTPNGTAVWSTETGKWPYDADRLPYGELSGDARLERMNRSGDIPSRSTDSPLPFIERAYAGLSYVVSLPVWFQPWHIGVIVTAFVVSMLGGLLTWSGQQNR